VRPFGVSLLIAGYDDDRPLLYQVDPSGSYFAWKASAIGKNMVSGKTFLEKRYVFFFLFLLKSVCVCSSAGLCVPPRYNDDMELEDAVHTAILTLKEGFEGQMTEHNIEIGIISAEDKTFRKLTPAEIKDYLANIS